jgi:hypothetical protein
LHLPKTETVVIIARDGRILLLRLRLPQGIRSRLHIRNH